MWLLCFTWSVMHGHFLCYACPSLSSPIYTVFVSSHNVWENIQIIFCLTLSSWVCNSVVVSEQNFTCITSSSSSSSFAFSLISHGFTRICTIQCVVQQIRRSSESVLFLHHFDNPGLVLGNQPLIGDNYSSWNRSMIIALSVKNKHGSINGLI